MLTNKDIKKLIAAMTEIFPTRDEVVLKGEFYELKSQFSNLQTSVDHIAKRMEVFSQEMHIVNHRLENLETKTAHL